MIVCKDCGGKVKKHGDVYRCACGAEYEWVQRPRELKPLPPDPVPVLPPVPATVPVRECEAREVAEHLAVLREIGATDERERLELWRFRMGSRWSMAAAGKALDEVERA